EFGHIGKREVGQGNRAGRARGEIFEGSGERLAVGRGYGQAAVSSPVVALVGERQSAGPDVRVEVAPEVTDLPAGELGLAVEGHGAEARTALVGGGFEVVGGVDCAPDGAVVHDLGPGVGEVPCVDLLEDGVVGPAVVGLAEVAVGAELGVDERATLADGTV